MTRQLSDFIGRWAVTREITHVGAGMARFVGQATWTAHDTGANYFEVGTLEIAGHPPMQSERRYRWDHAMNVYFEDGRFFHTVPASGGNTQHWCDPDDYKVSYDFGRWPDWSARWQVTGPRKNYLMVSQYRQA